MLLDPRGQRHVTPTYSSWLTQVTGWFCKIPCDVTVHGVCTSVPDLKRTRTRSIRPYNTPPTPGKWKSFEASGQITPESIVMVHEAAPFVCHRAFNFEAFILLLPDAQKERAERIGRQSSTWRRIRSVRKKQHQVPISKIFLAGLTTDGDRNNSFVALMTYSQDVTSSRIG